MTFYYINNEKNLHENISGYLPLIKSFDRFRLVKGDKSEICSIVVIILVLTWQEHMKLCKYKQKLKPQ